MEKEILGSGYEKIKCDHCGGTGKCDCYSCCDEYDEKSGIFSFERKFPSYRREEYLGKIKGKIEVECSRCNGLGFLFVDMDGNIVVPKILKRE